MTGCWQSMTPCRGAWQGWTPCSSWAVEARRVCRMPGEHKCTAILHAVPHETCKTMKKKNHYTFPSQLRADQMPGPGRVC